MEDNNIIMGEGKQAKAKLHSIRYDQVKSKYSESRTKERNKKIRRS